MLFKTFGPAYSVSSFLQLIYTFMQLATPQLVNLLISFISSDEPIWKGYLYCFLVLAVSIINTVLFGQYCYIQDEVGLRLQTAITSAIYRKSFRLSSLSKQQMTGIFIEHLVLNLLTIIPYLSWRCNKSHCH